MDNVSKTIPLSVVIIVSRSRPGDGKITKLLSAFRNRVESVVVDDLSSQNQKLDQCKGWIMMLPDDSLVDMDRLCETVVSFQKFATPKHVLLPYKTRDACNLGASFSRGQFYLCSEVRSFRGIIFHSKLLNSLDMYDRLHPQEFELRSTVEDPISLVRPKSSISLSRSFKLSRVFKAMMDECEASEDASDARKDSDTFEMDVNRAPPSSANSQLSTVANAAARGNDSEGEDRCMSQDAKAVSFHLPLKYKDQECLLTWLEFYTVFPNVVTFDTTYASKRSDMLNLNECNVFPSTVGQYMKALAYENMYVLLTVGVILTLVFIIVVNRFLKEDSKERSH